MELCGVTAICPVCQETIWEAFKIFWDRLPEQDEYQSWMNKCQQATVTARDIGSYFSQSDEHQALVKKVRAGGRELFEPHEQSAVGLITENPTFFSPTFRECLDMV